MPWQRLAQLGTHEEGALASPWSPARASEHHGPADPSLGFRRRREVLDWLASRNSPNT